MLHHTLKEANYCVDLVKKRSPSGDNFQELWDLSAGLAHLLLLHSMGVQVIRMCFFFLAF